jgi:hypothetical protein
MRIGLRGLAHAFTLVFTLVFATAAIAIGDPLAICSATLAIVMEATWLYLGPGRGRRTGLADSEAATPALRLLELLENAPRMPIVRGELRVAGPPVHEIVAELRGGISGSDVVLRAAEAVEDEVRNARPVSLSDEVRLPRERVSELIAGLRAAGA